MIILGWYVNTYFLLAISLAGLSLYFDVVREKHHFRFRNFRSAYSIFTEPLMLLFIYLALASIGFYGYARDVVFAFIDILIIEFVVQRYGGRILTHLRRAST